MLIFAEYNPIIVFIAVYVSTLLQEIFKHNINVIFAEYNYTFEEVVYKHFTLCVLLCWVRGLFPWLQLSLTFKNRNHVSNGADEHKHST